MPWRNGGGVTRELWREPTHGDSFDWRVSVAQVDHDGPFSSFPGYERILVLLVGAGMDLHAGDETVEVRPPLGAHRFPGEQPIEATLPGGPTSDFNLMWRRDAFDAELAVVAIDGAVSLGALHPVLCFVAGGSMRVGGEDLHVGDLALLDGAQRVEGRGTVLVCSLRPISA
ncbi:MAG: HutD family protein [Actinobacteria bacterium]|nr:HutD family protein [Actinomycetota bacterium]